MIMRSGEVHACYIESDEVYERFNLRFSPELLKENLNSRLLPCRPRSFPISISICLSWKARSSFLMRCI